MKRKLYFFVLLALIGWSVVLNAQPIVQETQLGSLPFTGYQSLTPNTTIGNNIYLFGAVIPPYASSPTASDIIRVYNISTNTWSALSFQMPYPIFDYSRIAYFNNHFYCGPGFTTGNSNGFGSHKKTIDINLNSNTATETTNQLSASNNWNSSSIEFNGKIYFIGGYSGTASMNTIYEFNPSTNSFNLVANFNTARNSSCIFLGNDGWIYCLGGLWNATTIERFNPTTYQVQNRTTLLESITVGQNIWHISSENSIYFFSSEKVNPIIYKYNYLTDFITNTGTTMNGTFWNRSIMDNNNSNIIYAFKADPNTSSPLQLVKLIINSSSCQDTIINDTITYFVSSPEFQSLSPKTVFENTDSLTTQIGGCDSVIYHYSKFVYNPTYCSDTIYTTVTLYDTTFVTVFDTIYNTVTIYDSIAVTDTLIIDVTFTGVAPPNNLNTIKVYPNPTKDKVYINTGNYALMPNYRIKIVTSLGQIIFENLVNQPLFEVDISAFGALGLYYIQLFDDTNQMIDVRKILLE